MADLSGAFAKLDRADEHFAMLETSVRLWINSDPVTFAGKHKPDKTEVSMHLNLKVAPDLQRWGILVGDCVHNLRSALDHVAWQCALAGGEPPWGTEFPITKSRDVYFGTGEYNGRPGIDKIRGVKDPAQRALFERVQPWHNLDGIEKDSLWFIHELDRMDKHQVIYPVLLTRENIRVSAVIEYADEATAATFGPPVVVLNDKPLHDGAEAFALLFAVAPVKVQVDGRGLIGIGIEYGAMRGGLDAALTNMRQHTRRIVEEFRNVL